METETELQKELILDLHSSEKFDECKPWKQFYCPNLQNLSKLVYVVLCQSSEALPVGAQSFGSIQLRIDISILYTVYQCDISVSDQ